MAIWRVRVGGIVFFVRGRESPCVHGCGITILQTFLETKYHLNRKQLL